VLLTVSAAVMNTDGVRINAVLSTDTSSRIYGNILCSNTASGLRLLANIALNAEANWWGDPSGPMHPGNPGGLGNAVIDGSNGGAGSVDFTPFIDTITASAPPSAPVNQQVPVDFQFSGGNGTVFLGFPPEFGVFIFEPFPQTDPPFTVTTDNGVLETPDQTGPVVHAAVNQPEGVLRVVLQGGHPGAATVTLDGPCGLDATAVVERLGNVATPLLSPVGLGALAIALGGLGIALRRRRDGASKLRG
jgi:hypothetical protein